MVKIGFNVGLKWPMCTVCGLGINMYSAAFECDVVKLTETANMLQVSRIEMWDSPRAIRHTP
jgi:hypothetical protein